VAEKVHIHADLTGSAQWQKPEIFNPGY